MHLYSFLHNRIIFVPWLVNDLGCPPTRIKLRTGDGFCCSMDDSFRSPCRNRSVIQVIRLGQFLVKRHLVDLGIYTLQERQAFASPRRRFLGVSEMLAAQGPETYFRMDFYDLSVKHFRRQLRINFSDFRKNLKTLPGDCPAISGPSNLASVFIILGSQHCPDGRWENGAASWSDQFTGCDITATRASIWQAYWNIDGQDGLWELSKHTAEIGQHFNRDLSPDGIKGKAQPAAATTIHAD
ncbi:MAG TPA: hypothetical protein VNW97_11730 [Candidatus Saccharimonadales bacterium]|jgi:hypothetical protein|nr:hypothetical protein [Candidatus Saccharimonadales bacterium]